MKIYSEDCINQAILSCRNLEELKTKLDSFDENDCMVLDSFDVAEDDVVAFMFPEKVPVYVLPTVRRYANRSLAGSCMHP